MAGEGLPKRTDNIHGKQNRFLFDPAASMAGEGLPKRSDNIHAKQNQISVIWKRTFISSTADAVYSEAILQSKRLRISERDLNPSRIKVISRAAGVKF